MLPKLPLLLAALLPLDAAEPLKFEVASIKPATSAGRGGLEILPGGGIHFTGFTVKDLIVLAYDIRESQISGGPKWLGSASYEVLAKPEHPDPIDRRPAAPGTPSWGRLQERLRSLLAERCQLTIHKVSKEAAVYALVLAKSGSKLTESREGDATPPRTMRSSGAIEAHNGSIGMLATVLSNWLGRPVEDRTGLAATYDYKLQYNTDPDLAQSEVFAALQEQLGLKLEPAKGTVDTIVVDRVQKPSAN